MKKLLLGLVLFANLTFAGVVSDGAIGYSVTLPTNWVQLKTKPLQNYFRDSTRTYPSQISIVRYDIDTTYPTPDSWSETQFIAYKYAVEYSVYPYGAVAYFDSSATAKIGTHWAPEALSVFYPADGTPTYMEYIRYCANGKFGYEIYAIGDSTDMANHVDFYAGIMSGIQLSTPTVTVSTQGIPAMLRREPTLHDEWFDLRGRRLPAAAVLRQPFFRR